MNVNLCKFSTFSVNKFTDLVIRKKSLNSFNTKFLLF